MKPHLLTALAFVAAVTFGCACAPSDPPPGVDTAARQDELAGANGMTSNGLSTNGMTSNGLSTNGMTSNGMTSNGLSTNGLSTNGLSTNGFSTWYNVNAAYSEMVMKYVVRCALPTGASRSWTNPVTLVTSTWAGTFGLAPTWASGAAIPLVEQQLMTACLAAHVNKFGVSVQLSVLGYNSTGAQLPWTSAELSTYGVKEGCFFGNLFNGEGVFAGLDRTSLNSKESSARACALEAGHAATQCPPIVDTTLQCGKICALEAAQPKAAYTTCTFHGKVYKAITTRLRSADVYVCGDQICQLSEHCGPAANSNTWDNCALDCGVCR